MPKVDWTTVIVVFVLLAIAGMVLPKLRSRVTGA
jgi:hypothetical protein